jgi:hypothetical protein
VIPFSTYFRTLGPAETRSVRVHGRPGVPDGEYGLFEFYCDQPGCDCRRVIFQVIAGPPVLRNVATINYGWESAEFYSEWSGIPELGQEMEGASLEPFGEQSPYSRALLDLVRELLEDEAYVDRLKEHYRLFREEVARRAERRQRGLQWKKPSSKPRKRPPPTR